MSKERPWEAGPFEPWVSDELNYRVNHLSKGISDYPNDGNKVEYSGPRKAWARVFSNGMNLTKRQNLTTDGETEWGLVFKSGNGFFERYGVSNNQNNQTKQVYGYSNLGNAKYVDSQTRINVPDPGITSIETEIQKNFFSKVTINWVCHSIDQLKAIAPYFTTPLTTVIVEFGWNTFDPISIIPISNYSTISKIWSNHYTDYSDRLKMSKGNYDYIFGQIVNFEYSIEDNIIKGKTEVYSRQTFYNGFVSDGSEGINIETKEGKEPREKLSKYFNEVITQIVGSETSPTSGITNIQLKDLLGTVKDSSGSLKYGKQNKDGPVTLEKLNDYVFTARNVETAMERDFDHGTVDKNKNTWITMELLVDILNQIKNINNKELMQFYYEMDIDDIKIGAHRNLISTDKRVLIPNPYAPKLNSKESLFVQVASQPKQTRDKDPNISKTAANVKATVGTAAAIGISLGVGALFAGEIFTTLRENFSSPEVIDENGTPTLVPVLKQSFNEHSPVTGSYLSEMGDNYTLASYAGFKNGKIQREDLDWVLNRNNRPSQNRTVTVFNFKENEKDTVEKGWLKNLYINLDFIKTTVSNVSFKTLREIYDEILKTVNAAVCSFWDLQVSDVPNEKGEIAKLKIIDHKGPFNFKSSEKVFNFEYMTNTSIIKKLNFTTTLSNAQANQVLFRASDKEYTSSTNLIDFTSKNQFRDRILKNLPNKPVNGSQSKDNSQKLSYFKKIAADGNKNQDGFLQITTFSNKKNEGGELPFNIVDLVIPYTEILTFLLNDNDLDNNINIYNSPLRNIHVELSLMGIAGIKTFEVFKISNLPPPYTEDQVVFQVENVMHTINEDTWETRIKANLRPARLLLKQSQNK